MLRGLLPRGAHGQPKHLHGLEDISKREVGSGVGRGGGRVAGEGGQGTPHDEGPLPLLGGRLLIAASLNQLG